MMRWKKIQNEEDTKFRNLSLSTSNQTSYRTRTVDDKTINFSNNYQNIVQEIKRVHFTWFSIDAIWEKILAMCLMLPVGDRVWSVQQFSSLNVVKITFCCCFANQLLQNFIWARSSSSIPPITICVRCLKRRCCNGRHILPHEFRPSISRVSRHISGWRQPWLYFSWFGRLFDYDRLWYDNSNSRLSHNIVENVI